MTIPSTRKAKGYTTKKKRDKNINNEAQDQTLETVDPISEVFNTSLW